MNKNVGRDLKYKLNRKEWIGKSKTAGELRGTGSLLHKFS